MITLNRIVAFAMVHGPVAGLAALDEAALDHYRVDAVRAHLLELAGDVPSARDAYLRAARATASLPERRYLESRAAHLV
jgi:predicted RNA polymerase sigma factor